MLLLRRAALLGLIVWFLLSMLLMALGQALDVQAAAPGDRCDACRIQPAPSARPTPIVVGLPTPRPTARPTLPPTDTEG